MKLFKKSPNLKLGNNGQSEEINTLRCIIPSYKISGDDFIQILELAEKNGASWNYPTQIVKLLSNPLPLFIFDEIHIDKIAFHETLSFLEQETKSKTIPDLLEKIGKLKQIKFFNSEEIIGLRMPSIRNAMLQDKEDDTFKRAVKTIEDSQGNYASPNNYLFELINMNITTALLSHFKNAIPYDQSYRSLLYEQKIVNEMKLIGKYSFIDGRLKEIRKYHIAQPPLRIENINDITTIEKEYNSQKVTQLREKLRQSISNSTNFSNFLKYELSGPPRDLSNLSTGWDVFCDSATTFGAWMGAMTATGGWAIPCMIIYAIANGKLIRDLIEWDKRDDFLWYEGLLTVLQYIQDNQQEFSSNKKR